MKYFFGVITDDSKQFREFSHNSQFADNIIICKVSEDNDIRGKYFIGYTVLDYPYPQNLDVKFLIAQILIRLLK